jgi:Uma2 family endonuclease
MTRAERTQAMSISSNAITAEQFFQRPDLEHCELIEGEVVALSPAGGHHGASASIIDILLGHYVLEHDLGMTYAAETGFLIQRGPDTVLAPDFAFIANERLPDWSQCKSFVPAVPDLVVEVVSPGDRFSEVELKAKRWLDAGCQDLFVIDPESKTVRRRLHDGIIEVLDENATIDAGDLVPGWTLQVARIFKQK